MKLKMLKAHNFLQSFQNTYKEDNATTTNGSYIIQFIIMIENNEWGLKITLNSRKKERNFLTHGNTYISRIGKTKVKQRLQVNLVKNSDQYYLNKFNFHNVYVWLMWETG